jgi:hypothetical protein
VETHVLKRGQAAVSAFYAILHSVPNIDSCSVSVHSQDTHRATEIVIPFLVAVRELGTNESAMNVS